MRGNYPLACFPAAGEKRALTYRMGRIRPEPPLERCPGERGGSIQEQPRPRQLPPAPPPPPAPGCSDPALCLPGARPGGLPQPSRAPLPSVYRREISPQETVSLPGGGTHGAGARTGALGCGQIPGIQLKSWLAPLAGRRSRGICIMKIDSSKLPAWQPGRAPAGRGDPAVPAGAPGAPRSRTGGCGDLRKAGGAAAPASLQRGGQTFLERKDLFLAIFLL